MTSMRSPTTTSADALRAAEAAYLERFGVAVEQHDSVLDGVNLHWLSCGAGEPLLLVHGRGSAGAFFGPILAQLAAQRRVLTLDLPGWGLSDKPPFAGTTPQEALAHWREAVRAFLDAQGIEQIDVLGHSMGGFTALSLALEHPERVARLLLVDPGGLGTSVQFDLRLYYAIGPERLHRWLGERFTSFVIRQDGAADAPKPGDPAFDFRHAIASQGDVVPSGARAFSRWVNLSGVHLTLRERLTELEIPVLLMWGDRDTVTPYADALTATRYLRDGQLVTFNRCGHAPFAERPDDFAQVVLAWLDGLYIRPRV